MAFPEYVPEGHILLVWIWNTFFLSRMRLTDSKIPLLSVLLVVGGRFYVLINAFFFNAVKETYFLQNNFPALMLLLLSITCLYVLKKD